jgi:hypothetical protein
MTGHLELWVLGLLAAVAGLVMLSNRLGVPYPVFLVLGGLALGLIPIVPEIGLPPDLILLIFLPPLLYSAAFFSSLAARHSEQAESGEEDNGYEERSLAYQRFRRELLGAEREELLRLRREGRISDEVRRRVERDLDLEDARLEI